MDVTRDIYYSVISYLHFSTVNLTINKVPKSGWPLLAASSPLCMHACVLAQRCYYWVSTTHTNKPEQARIPIKAQLNGSATARRVSRSSNTTQIHTISSKALDPCLQHGHGSQTLPIPKVITPSIHSPRSSRRQVGSGPAFSLRLTACACRFTAIPPTVIVACGAETSKVPCAILS